jgi:hypothetical protein
LKSERHFTRDVFRDDDDDDDDDEKKEKKKNKNRGKKPKGAILVLILRDQRIAKSRINRELSRTSR